MTLLGEARASLRYRLTGDDERVVDGHGGTVASTLPLAIGGLVPSLAPMKMLRLTPSLREFFTNNGREGGRKSAADTAAMLKRLEKARRVLAKKRKLAKD